MTPTPVSLTPASFFANGGRSSTQAAIAAAMKSAFSVT